MADRTSAEIFGRILQLLANVPTIERQQLGRDIMQLSREYDFTPDQMYADEACWTLDIIRLGIHPKYPQEGKLHLYFGDPGFDEAGTPESSENR